MHHAKRLHAHNYSDLPLWDLCLGTFRDPAGYEHETGFHPGASARVWEMLSFRDASEPADAAEERREAVDRLAA